MQSVIVITKPNKKNCCFLSCGLDENFFNNPLRRYIKLEGVILILLKLLLYFFIFLGSKI